jgi:hypothetical protein
MKLEASEYRDEPDPIDCQTNERQRRQVVEGEDDKRRSRYIAGYHANDLKDAISHTFSNGVVRKTVEHGFRCLLAIAAETDHELRFAPRLMQFPSACGASK